MTATCLSQSVTLPMLRARATIAHRDAALVA